MLDVQLEGRQDSLLGSVLEGRYRLVGVLGRGGMGSVYLAEETRLGRRYALKVLRPELAKDRSYVERFLREAQTIARLSHPNIVDIHSFGEDPSGLVFFTMELLEGEDLETRLVARAVRPYGVRDVCRWAIGIARALAVVHDHGLIHRDLKPQNVFLARSRDGEDVVKLLDFGIARPENGPELTRTGVALGTPSYMSPEQLRNKTLDKRSDIYSFGVVLYKLATGRLPFLGDAIQVGVQHVQDEVPLPSLVAPEARIPPALDALVLKAMSKRPDDRPASMAELEQALVAIGDAEVVDQQPPVPGLHAGAPSGALRRLALTVTLPAREALPGVRTAGPDRALDGTTANEPTLIAGNSALSPGPDRYAPDAAAATTRSARPATAIDPSAVEITAAAVANANATNPAVAVVHDGLASPGIVSSWSSRAPVVAAALAALVALVVWIGPGSGGNAPTVAAGRPPLDVADVAPSPPETQIAVSPELPPTPATDAPSLQGEKEAPSAQVPPPAAATTAPLTTSTKKKPRPPPPAPKKATAPAPVDPIARVKERAMACRRQHHEVGSPKVTIVYAVDAKGGVMSATAPSNIPSAFGSCLTAAIKAAAFPPKRLLNQKIDL